NEQDYDEAIRRFRQVLAIDPRHAAAYIHLGVSYAAQGKFEASITSYQQAKDLRADLAGVVEQSIDLVERLRHAKQHPDDPSAQKRLGELYASDGRFDRAIECFEKATTLDPHSPRRSSRSRASMRRKNAMPKPCAHTSRVSRSIRTTRRRATTAR